MWATQITYISIGAQPDDFTWSKGLSVRVIQDSAQEIDAGNLAASESDFRHASHETTGCASVLICAWERVNISQNPVLHGIDEAIALDREALELCPPAHPKRDISLISLATHIGDRYHELKATTDLEEVIVVGREALGLRPKERPARSFALIDLAMDLSIRYEQLGAMQDLDEAIVLGREAVCLRPQGHPERPVSLNNLTVQLSGRYATPSAG